MVGHQLQVLFVVIIDGDGQAAPEVMEEYNMETDELECKKPVAKTNLLKVPVSFVPNHWADLA